MEVALNSVVPLSPYMWDAPHRDVAQPGTKVGKVADVLHHLADLELRFDLIAKEFDYPYAHPVFDVFDKHQIHTRALNKRQFDVLRYGLVLDEVERLVLLPAPRNAADSGVRIARKYSAIFHDSLDDKEVAKHPILPEYCFVVYRLPSHEEVAAGNNVPTPIFRIIFRNEAYKETDITNSSDCFPLYYLRGIYVSNTKYYSIVNQLHSYRKFHPNVLTTDDGKVVPNLAVERILFSPEVKNLCDAWVHVVEGIAPTWVVEKGIGPDAVDMFLSTHCIKGNRTVEGRLIGSPVEQVDNRIRISYYTMGRRMKQRVRVMKRDKSMIPSWQDGGFDLKYYAEENTSCEPVQLTARCARILLRETRSGINDISKGEICAYVPEEWEYKEENVYRTPAAERLRLWVLKGLMTAEIEGVHAVLVEVDTALLLSQCVGLLWGGREDGRYEEVVFHVCKIVVETVEDYVQHSGVVWQATIVVCDVDNTNAASLCEDILELTQTTKCRVEVQELIRMSNVAQQEADRLHSREMLEECTTQSVSRLAAARQGAPPFDASASPHASNGCPMALVPVYGNGPITWPLKSTIPEYLVKSATAAGVQVDDDTLYPLFESLCVRDTHLVLVKTIIDLLLAKLAPSENKREYAWLYDDHPLLALDHCGIPCDATSVTNFVMGFSMKRYGMSETNTTFTNETRSVKRAPCAPALNYVEFSMMMLALARQ